MGALDRAVATLPFLLFLLAVHTGSCQFENEAECDIAISISEVVLTGVPFIVTITLPPFLPNNETIPELVYFSVEGPTDYDNISYIETRTANGTSKLTLILNETTVTPSGYHNLTFNFSRSFDTEDPKDLICSPQVQTLLAIPGVLTLIGPVVTAILAVVFRQVLLALLVGIWICATFANQYNPLIGLLRTLDTYIVHSIATPTHAAIIIFSFFLGGLIGVVQKSGGGIGLARLLFRFTNSRRKATVVCTIICFLIFFDDYSAVLIPGNSLRSVMSTAGVSKEKFAFLLQSIGPALASIVPISSWIGVEVGYVHSSFDNALCGACPNSTDDFVLIIETIPYRFFPLLMLFCAVLVSLLGRDFGPMLTAERDPVISSDMPPPDVPQKEDELDDDAILIHEMRDQAHSVASTELDEDTYSGPLAPKKGIPYRWFNAAIPFLTVILFTLLGMILGGRQAILDLPEKERIDVTAINIFSKADSISALIWSCSLASFVLLVMLLLQRILKLSEFMEVWIEGIKDIMEPLMILLLAWALGDAIEAVHTNVYIAQVLKNGGVSVNYIPTIVTIIGFTLAFATGSAFGTMGLLFPLVIPTVCRLAPCNKVASVQAVAAILSSSLFGNAISPIADITILTGAATKCEHVPHLKTAFPYVFLVGFISLIFGALPVGAGWYPWYAAWIIMPSLLCFIFIVFSTNFSSMTSRPLLKRVFPCLYSIPGHLYTKFKAKFERLVANCRVKFRRKKSVFEQDAPGKLSYQPNEKTGLLSPHGTLRSRPSLISTVESEIQFVQ